MELKTYQSARQSNWI